MSETAGQGEASVQTARKGSMVWYALGGLAIGLFAGVAFVGLDVFLRGRDAIAIPLTTFLIIYPLIGAGLGCLLHQHPAARKWRRPASFFAVQPLSDEEREERGRRVKKYVWTGFGTGIVISRVSTALDFAWRGWPFLAHSLITSLMLSRGSSASPCVYARR